METKAITVDLGFIGNKADQLQALYKGYDTEPNENGYYLRFENISYIGNKGVILHTNCFESEEHFLEDLQTKLLFNL